MDATEYTEKTVEATLREARAGYDALHERAYKFATLTLGAVGAVAIYISGKIGTPGFLAQILTIAPIATWWFAVAARLLLKGASTRPVTIGPTSAKLRERLAQHGIDTEGKPVEDQGLHLTRWDQLASMDRQIEALRLASDLRARALDASYKWMVASPIGAAPGLLFAVVAGQRII